jgi:hypothetical protein
MICRLALLAMLFLASSLAAQNDPEPHDGHGAQSHQRFDANGIVMHANATELPRDCEAISGAYEFTVRAGTTYASAYAGNAFGLSQHEYLVAPCSLVTVTFINEDDIRHQWMLHGLPLYLYPQGMFHLEAAGGQQVTGSFIVPSDNRTYLVHCDMTQHMEKGMKGQLVAGSGSGNLWSVPGISGVFRTGRPGLALGVGLVLATAVMSFLVMTGLSRRTE